jgi:hypothetical protein
MITEDYCSFEVAKLLKEKGFDEPCTELNKLCLRDGEKPVLKVTHQKAMKWLREKKKLFINVWYDGIDFNVEYVVNIGDFTYIGNYSSYEQAVEAALKYSLKKFDLK